jgi:hypothetical protein
MPKKSENGDTFPDGLRSINYLLNYQQNNAMY